MLKAGWTEGVEEQQPRHPLKCTGLDKASDLQCDLHSEEILRVLENTEEFCECRNLSYLMLF